MVMGKVYSQEIRELAFEKYMLGDSFDKIAESMNNKPNAKTIRAWAKDEDWKHERDTRNAAPAIIEKAIMQALNKELKELESSDGDIRKQSLDRINKTYSTLFKIQSKNSKNITVALEVGEHFVAFYKKNISKFVPPQHRNIVSSSLAELMMSWYGSMLSDPQEVFNA